MTDHRFHIAIVGGSFAGLSAAQALPAKFAVTLIDRRAHFEWTPNVHELVSGVKAPELLSLDLQRLMSKRGHRFVQTEVTGIDTGRKMLALQGQQAMQYDACLLAIGGADARERVPGAQQHSTGFRTITDCHRIGQRLAALAKLGSVRVTIVGGGVSGIEALGEILRIYRDHPGLQVSVVESAARLLPEGPPELDEDIRARCAGYPVQFFLQSRVHAVSESRVTLADGRCIDSELTIWAAGQAQPALLQKSGLCDVAGQAPVRATLQARLAPEIFVAGDCAVLSRPVRRQAYHAIEMGEHAASNIRRYGKHRKLKKYRPSHKPVLVAFGDLDTYLVAGQHVIASPSLAGAKEALFQGGMALFAPPLQKQEARNSYRRFSQSMRKLLAPSIGSLDDAIALGRYRRIS